MTAPRFLADENVRRPILHAARQFYPAIQIATAQELGLTGTPDPELLDFADRHGCIVVSHDVNTLRRAAEERMALGQDVAGLLLAPLHHPTRAVAESLAIVAGTSEAEDGRTASSSCRSDQLGRRSLQTAGL